MYEFCDRHKVFVLFSPRLGVDCFMPTLTRFRDVWRNLLQTYVIREDPNTKLAFMFLFKQAMRSLFISDTSKQAIEALAAVRKSNFSRLVRESSHSMPKAGEIVDAVLACADQEARKC